jgi:hypothetical protein
MSVRVAKQNKAYRELVLERLPDMFLLLSELPEVTRTNSIPNNTKTAYSG